MNDTGKVEIRLNHGLAAKDSNRWELKNNHRLFICGLQSGYMITLTDVSGRKLFSTVTTINGSSITIYSTKSGCFILSMEDENNRVLKRNLICAL